MKTQNSCNFNPLLKYHVHMKNELAQQWNIIGLKRLVMTCCDTNGAKKVKLLMAR